MPSRHLRRDALPLQKEKNRRVTGPSRGKVRALTVIARPKLDRSTGIASYFRSGWVVPHD